MNNIIDLQQSYRALWGAHQMPFQDLPADLYLSPELQQIEHKLIRYMQLGVSGLLTGGNGVGKSVLLQHALRLLPEKQFAVLQLSHSTISGSDMIRRLCRLNGLRTSIRRSENIQLLIEFWQSDGRKPILVFDEAQLLDPATLEEIRLLNCERIHNSSKQPTAPFVTVLCGDEDLLHLIQLNIHRALRSRLAFSLKITPFNQEQTIAYVHARWQQVGVQQNPFNEQALCMLHDASEGIARNINQIARHAVIQAIDQSVEFVTAKHIEQALEELPWLPVF